MQNYKKNFVKQTLAWVLAAVMVITMLPVGVFAEVEKADWTINEQKEAEMSFWKLADINEVVVVANAEGMKTPTINYIGTYINAEGRTVVRVSFRAFQNLATAVWHKALFKFDKDLYNLIDFTNPGTGMYKGTDNEKWHDADTYKEVVPFTDAVSSISGGVHVKEQNLKNNKNLVGGASRIEVPIDLVLNEGKTVADIKGQPHIQMRLTSEDYKRVFCVAGTGKADDDTTDADQNLIVTPYNSYTFMTFIPSANNNADVNTVEDYNRDLQFYAANSYAKYNEAGGYLDVFHKQSKLNSTDNIGGEYFAFRQVFNEKFAQVLKPQDESGTVAEVFPANQQGDMWKNASPIQITKADLNDSNNSELNPGFVGIQVASNAKGNIGQNFAGLKTVLTTAAPQNSYLNSATTEFNSGLPTITRYYIDKDKVAEKGLKTDDLASFDFYSTFILDSTKKFIEYTATNDTGSDIVLEPNSILGLTYADGKTSRPNQKLYEYSLTFGDDAYKIDLRSNFKPVGGGPLQHGHGREYEYNLIPGMTIKSGEKITFRTMKYDTPPTRVTLTLPSKDGNKTIDLLPGAEGAEKTTPRRLNYITTYAGGSATQSGVNPDIDELFTDSQNIAGRTRYVGAKIKLFYPDNTDYEFTIADQKTRTKMKVNGAEVNGYTFTTEGKTGFAMPTELVKDSVIGITNTDVKKASTPSEKAFEKVQAKVTFDLNGGKLATNVKSFEGFDTTQLPGTEFAYKLQRANETAPVVRIAPMNEKAAGDADYKPNGFNVSNYTDHNGDALKGDALELRKFVADKPTIESADNLVFLGWTTKKLSGTAEAVTEAFEELQKNNKVATTADQVNGTEAYIFNDASPITTATTVYAVYGKNQESAKYEPKYEDVDGTVGTLATVAAPKFLDEKSTTDPKPEANPQPTGMKFALGDGAPADAQIDEDTGVITYKPVKGDTTVTIPVVVTYSDGTKDNTTATINVTEESDKDIIPYEPTDPENPTDPEDPKIPDKDEDDKPINKDEYDIVAFKTESEQKGTLTKGKEANKPVISVLVKKGSKARTFGDVKPSTNPVEGYNFWYWDKDGDQTKTAVLDNAAVANGEIYTAYFIKSGDEVGPNDPDLPDNFVKVTYKAGTGVDKFAAKTVAVEKGTKEDKLPGKPEVKIDGTVSTDVVWTADPAIDANDGIQKDTTLTVSAKTPGQSDKDKYDPKGQDITVEKDETPNAEDGIKNKDELPDKTEYDWKNTPDTSKPGETTGTVVVTYPDGTTDEVEVRITVTEKKPFDKDNVVKAEYLSDPDKMLYYEGEKLNLKGIKIKLTDINGNIKVVGADELNEYGITVEPTEGTTLTIAGHNNKKLVIKVTVKENNDSVVKTFESFRSLTVTEYVPVPEKSDKPIINPIYDSDDYVTGEGVPGATVEVRFPDGTIERVIVDGDGRWVAPTPYPLYDEEIVEARQIEFGKEPSDWVYEKVRYDDEYWRERDRRDRDDKKEDTKKPSKVEPRWTPPALNARDHFSYIKGYGNNMFAPNRTITRAEVAMIFARLSINQSTGGAPQFKDVKAGDWYKTAVDIMARQGVIKGYEDGTFRPNQPITRREFAAIAARYAGNLDTWKTFRDVPPTDWAYKLINRVAGAGWINGYEDGTFRPNNNITRAEVVAIVNRMLNRKADAKYVDNNLMRTKGAFVDNMRSAWYYYDIYEAAFGHSYERLDNGVDEKWNRVTGQAFEIRER